MEKWIIMNKPYNNYAISDYGNIKNIKNNQFIKQFIRKDGYVQVTLWNCGKGHSLKVHRLVALYFLENNDDTKIYVNHIDGNKANNNVSNLEWVTPSENNIHAVKNGLVNAIKVKVIDLNDNKEYIFDSISQAALFLNENKRCISRALKRKNGIYHNYKFIRI